MHWDFEVTATCEKAAFEQYIDEGWLAYCHLEFQCQLRFRSDRTQPSFAQSTCASSYQLSRIL